MPGFYILLKNKGKRNMRFPWVVIVVNVAVGRKF